MRILGLLLVVMVLPGVSWAQGTLTSPQTHKNPMVVTADQTLEWNRAEKQFTARGNAKAEQGDVALLGEVLKAYYADNSDKNFDIQSISASDNVQIHSGESIIYGDEADYDLLSDKAIVTGTDLKMVSGGNTLRSRDRFEYWPNRGFFQAIGAPRITSVNEKGQVTTLTADTLTATFEKNAYGANELQKIDVKGHVVITTPTEVLTSDEGTYYAGANRAEVRGNVEITRGPNILEGTRAEVDLNTNISKIFAGDTGAGQRVRGVFYPGSN